MTLPRPPIGESLRQRGLISADQLHIALREQARSGEALGRQLVLLGFVSETALRDALAHALACQSVDLTSLIPDQAALALLHRDQARRLRLLPISHDDRNRRLILAAAHSDTVSVQDHLRALLPADTGIELRLAGDSEIDQAIDRFYGHELSIDGILREIETGVAEPSPFLHPGEHYAQPVVRLIDALLADAVRRSASDIHFEPESAFLRIRYRLDGLLRQIRALHQSCWPAMAVRLKVMAGLNIAETRAPQDGRISLQISGRPVDFRIATQPTIHGENIVLRILDRQKGIVPLHGLGLSDTHLDTLKLMIARPEGLILVTGPTGSGKTTTLYSMLGHINAETINIMTLEDPVEYPMPQIRQTTVADAARLDFANGVRSMLRQDPDVILVGEIRDGDTARMAFQAAMTGHQVYSTLHTSSALGALPRLRELGVPAEILSGNLIGILAQRLLRRLCQHCLEMHPAEEYELRLLGLDPSAERPLLPHAKGCPACEHQGYRGRLAIMELLRFDEDLEELVARHATHREIQNCARQKGFRPLAEDGSRLVLAGITSLEELSRVVDLSGRLHP
ncbi:GspE/PulE family protein [Zoogloea sp.]|uniref:GspE/PulE family protein n=1 Tax=Zoogloea sp. TaxID=49181 RepID=UPI00261DE532|nr:GspE/PulE family protein [Zoogloea sp.]MDD3353121.1 GspE/PulE family protein [Zoogloea sp.]